MNPYQFNEASRLEVPKTYGSLDTKPEHVSSVTERMLDRARAKTEEFTLKEEETSLHGLLQTAQLSVDVMAKQKNISIAISKNSQNVWLNLDPRLTTPMLTNLLHNAVKFAPDGGRISLWVRDTGVGETHVEIVDNGPGMSPAQIEGFLGSYDEIGHIKPGEHGGTGLGLPLVRRLIELHGGRLELISGDTGGLTARLRFPAYRLCSVVQQAAKKATL